MSLFHQISWHPRYYIDQLCIVYTEHFNICLPLIFGLEEGLAVLSELEDLICNLSLRHKLGDIFTTLGQNSHFMDNIYRSGDGEEIVSPFILGGKPDLDPNQFKEKNGAVIETTGWAPCAVGHRWCRIRFSGVAAADDEWHLPRSWQKCWAHLPPFPTPGPRVSSPMMALFPTQPRASTESLNQPSKQPRPGHPCAWSDSRGFNPKTFPSRHCHEIIFLWKQIH